MNFLEFQKKLYANQSARELSRAKDWFFSLDERRVDHPIGQFLRMPVYQLCHAEELWMPVYQLCYAGELAGA